MTASIRWGPDPSAPRFAVLALDPQAAPRPDLLPRISRLAAALSLPVQVVRADRVLSLDHVAMAVDHALRARAGGRARAADAGIEFVLFLAGERQITPAIEAFGVPRSESDDAPSPQRGPPLLVVALGAVDEERFAASARDVGLRLAPDPRAAVLGDAAAWAWWGARLGVTGGSKDEIEARVLGAMARLAVARS